jgi:hypothetical protein
MRSCMVRSIELHWRAEKRGIRGRSATSPRRPGQKANDARPERIRGFDVLLLDQASNLKRPWDLPFRFPARRPNRPTPRYRVRCTHLCTCHHTCTVHMRRPVIARPATMSSSSSWRRGTQSKLACVDENISGTLTPGVPPCDVAHRKVRVKVMKTIQNICVSWIYYISQ